jgi:nicotinamidase/pyrazinamidase
VYLLQLLKRGSAMAIAYGIIDAQAGFMPTQTAVAGTGELGVGEGDLIIPLVNRLTQYALDQGWDIFTTQDWHPAQTAHFSATPNYTTTWPVHCVAGTAGAAIHPEIVVPAGATPFHKGIDVLSDGADDTSYSGYYAQTETGILLPAWIVQRQISHVYLVGLAFDYCVGSTALDLVQRCGVAVSVIIDATRPVAMPSQQTMLARLAAAGVTVGTMNEVVA